MIDVIAKKPGFYGGVRRRVGDVFTIKDETEMGKWMDKYVPSRDNGSRPMKGNNPVKDAPPADSKNNPVAVGEHSNEPGANDLKYMSGQSPKNIDKAKRNPRQSGMQGG